VLNAVLQFLVLFHVYLLKYVFSLIAQLIDGRSDSGAVPDGPPRILLSTIAKSASPSLNPPLAKEGAPAFAEQRGAVLAGSRCDKSAAYSLSPASLRTIPRQDRNRFGHSTTIDGTISPHSTRSAAACVVIGSHDAPYANLIYALPANVVSRPGSADKATGATPIRRCKAKIAEGAEFACGNEHSQPDYNRARPADFIARLAATSRAMIRSASCSPRGHRSETPVVRTCDRRLVADRGFVPTISWTSPIREIT
jgi:hypothetical protein